MNSHTSVLPRAAGEAAHNRITDALAPLFHEQDTALLRATEPHIREEDVIEYGSATTALPTAELLRQRGSKHYICALIRALPGLGFKLGDMPPERFDINQFMKASGPWSSSEKVLARFIASVWNPTTAASKKAWRYDLTDIASSINSRDKAVIMTWLLNPIYP